MKPGAEREAGRAPAIRRSARVLDLLAHDGPAPGARIGAGLGLAKSSTSDLLGSLEAGRWVRRAEARFVLGGLLTELGDGLVGNAIDLIRFGPAWAADPVLHQQTVAVQVVQGTEVLCVDVRVGRQLIMVTPRPGDRTRGWSGDQGTPALAALPEPELRETLDRFGDFLGLPVQERQAVLDWSASRRVTVPWRFGTAAAGNDELCVACPGGRAAVLAVPLPDGTSKAARTRIGTALAELAERCRPRARDASSRRW
ncbi:helix-turn-helix domain-containing protein [Microlunatus sp. GCM10028923]|uniref:helix-turn-helix domain-containing protein n=1 Tax=Microlunatus sp. GCM10028923 TaxID=3273400 RepID=UPI00360D2187